MLILRLAHTMGGPLGTLNFIKPPTARSNPYMPIMVVGALLSGIVLALLSPGIDSLAGELAIAGSLCYVAVLVIALSGRADQQTNRALVRSEPS